MRKATTAGLTVLSGLASLDRLWAAMNELDAVPNGKGETERLHGLLAERAGYRFMEELGTKPRVYYLPPKNRMYPPPGMGAGH